MQSYLNYQENSVDNLSINDSSNGARPRKKLDDYEILPQKDLGTGSFGRVILVRERTTGMLYALKEMSKKFFLDHNCIENLKREVKIHRKLRHPHITRLLHYFDDKYKVYLILEYAENGSLFKYIQNSSSLSEKEAFVYFFQTCLGIDYLHKKNIIHRDLKPENLLLDSGGNVKICDFGWSAETTGDRYTFCGTLEYMAPEILKRQPYTTSVDIWSLGVLLFELFHRRSPFEGRSPEEIERNIMSGQKNIKFGPLISEEAQTLIKELLQFEPTARLTMSEIFNHSWMKKMEALHNIKLESYIYKPRIKSPTKMMHNYSLETNGNYIDKTKVINVNNLLSNNTGRNKPPLPQKFANNYSSDNVGIYDNDYTIQIDQTKPNFYKSQTEEWNYVANDPFKDMRSQNLQIGYQNDYQIPKSPPSPLHEAPWESKKIDKKYKGKINPDENENNYNLDNSNEEKGFFIKILELIGCISRDKPKNKYVKKR